MLNEKFTNAISAVTQYPAIIETISGSVGGRDFSKLNLGSRYTGFQEGLKQRLDLLKDVLIKARHESPDKKSKKQQHQQ